MKRYIFLLVFAVVANFAQAQISEEEAKQAYQDAEEQYEEGNYYKCYQMCNDLMAKMGKPNPRILYLDLKAIHNILEGKGQGSDYTLRRNYKNFKRFSDLAADFFSLVDKNTYPAEKYNEIIEIQKYLNAGAKEYEHEKDRKPADAISFLNECAEKFYKKVKTRFGYYGLSTEFTLDSAFLTINIRGQSDDWDEQPKFREVFRGKAVIDLSKVWMEYRQYKFSNTISFNDLFKYNEQFANFSDGNAPLLISTISYSYNKEVYDAILVTSDEKFDRKFDYPQTEFEKKYTPVKSQHPFYIFQFFDHTSDEFQNENYRVRIHDAFDFLINYFGGGIPKESKQERKSKF